MNGGNQQPEWLRAKSAARQSALTPKFALQLKAAAGVAVGVRTDLEAVLKHQMKSPTPDMNLALALLRRWEQWFGPPSQGAPQSIREFGRELAVTWWANPTHLLKTLDGSTDASKVATLSMLLNNLKGAVANNPSVTVAQLMPESEAASVEKMQRFREAADEELRQRVNIDDLLSSEDEENATLKEAATSKEEPVPSRKPVSRTASGHRGKFVTVAPPADQPKKHPFTRSGSGLTSGAHKRRTPSPAKSGPKHEFLHSAHAGRQNRTPSPKSRPARKGLLAVPKKAKVGQGSDSESGSDIQQTESERTHQKLLRSATDGGWGRPRAASTKFIQIQQKDLVEKMQKAVDQDERKQRVYKNTLKEQRRREWEKANYDRKLKESRARDQAAKERLKHGARQQAHPEVVRLIARIQYALSNCHTMRTINGVKVKDASTLFNSLDVDKKGWIGKDDLGSGLARLNISFPDTSIELLMTELDGDSNGRLVKSEFLKWWQQIIVVQEAEKARENERIEEAASTRALGSKVAKGQRRIRSSASQVVAQLQFIFSGQQRRTLYGKEVKDPITFFRALDQDGSGKVHPCEIAAGLKRLDVSMTSGDTQALVEIIDRDQSGEMQIMEICSWLEYQTVGASVAQQIRDLFVERRTLFGTVVTDAASFFEACDLDGNEFMKFDEFCKGLKFMHMSVGYPELDALLATMGKDRNSLIGKEELCWALDQKAQWGRIIDN